MVWVMPLAAVLLTFGIVVVALHHGNRNEEMRHRERMAAIDKNLELPDSFWKRPLPNPQALLLRGLIWLAVGIGIALLSVGMWLAEGRTDNEMLAVGTVGVIPIGVGVAYLVVRRVEGQKGVGG